MLKVLMRHGVCLSGLCGICLSLRRLVVFCDILFSILVHFIIYLIMPPFYVTCVILLTIMLIHVLIMHDIVNMTLHHPQTILMLS